MPIGNAQLKKYAIHPVFVETGISVGNCPRRIAAMGKRYLGVEWRQKWIDNAKQYFKDDDQYRMWQGDSATTFPKAIEFLNELDEPATFWLDAHGNKWVGPEDVKKNRVQQPILVEIQALYALKKKDQHIILIDDWTNTKALGRSNNVVLDALLAWNPDLRTEIVLWDPMPRRFPSDSSFLAAVPSSVTLADA